jgi:hypothetical protein
MNGFKYRVQLNKRKFMRFKFHWNNTLTVYALPVVKKTLLLIRTWKWFQIISQVMKLFPITNL